MQESDDPVADAISGATISLVAAGLPMGPWSHKPPQSMCGVITCNAYPKTVIKSELTCDLVAISQSFALAARCGMHSNCLSESLVGP